MLSKRMNKSLAVLVLYFAGASTCALATVYELPADGRLLMEVHPAVDGEGQTAEVDLEVMSQKLRRALGQDTGAIHWDFARKALETATGVPTVVGLRAHLGQASASNAH
jgi:hypothetical protein